MSLPTSVKIALPEPFDGTFDLDILESYIFTMKCYFKLTGLSDNYQSGTIFTILGKESALVWLHT